jgi:hypothetical protein
VTTVRDPSPEAPAPDAPKRRGRGKTTPAVRAGQALAKILAWPAGDRLRLANMLRQGATAATVREAVKGSRKALKLSILAAEGEIASRECDAKLLDVVEGLDPAGRVAILGALGGVSMPADEKAADEVAS